MHFVENKINLMCQASFFISCLLVPVLALLVFIGTVTRALGISILGIFEISALLVGIIVFLGFGYVLLKGQHITVKVLTERLPLKASSVVCIIMAVFNLVWVISLFIGSCITWGYFMKNNITVGSLLDIPMWIPATSMIIGTGLLVLQSFCEIGRSITERKQKQIKIENIQEGLK